MKNQTCLTINESAKFLGVSVTTLKRYENENLITSARDENNYRQYQQDDLQTLKDIIEKDPEQIARLRKAAYPKVENPPTDDTYKKALLFMLPIILLLILGVSAFAWYTGQNTKDAEISREMANKDVQGQAEGEQNARAERDATDNDSKYGELDKLGSKGKAGDGAGTDDGVRSVTDEENGEAVLAETSNNSGETTKVAEARKALAATYEVTLAPTINQIETVTRTIQAVPTYKFYDETYFYEDAQFYKRANVDDLRVTEELQAYGGIHVYENAQFDEDLFIDDDVFIGDDLRVEDDLTIEDDTTIEGDLTVYGETNFRDGIFLDDGLFTLGSLSSDTSADNGAMYYNDQLQKFRCYEDSVWTDCIASAGTITFTGLTDTPNSYSAQSGMVVAVNATEDGLEYISVGALTGDKYVGVDASATSGYLGATSGTGVFRTNAPISYTDGGDFITLDISSGGIGATELAGTAVTGGSYGGASSIPTFTVDGDGRLTAAGSAVLNSDNVTEGSNLYLTNERVDDRVDALIQDGTGLSWTYVDGSNTLTGNVSLAGFDTDDLSEGSAQYFTNTRARLALSVAGTPLTYNSGTGEFDINQADTLTDGYLDSSDWNTFNGKLDGSGTQYYVPLWGAGDSLGDSIIYQTSGRIGIATTDPQYEFDVNGDLRIQGGEVYITPEASSASTTEGTLYYDSDNDNLYVYADGGWVDLTVQGGAGVWTQTGTNLSPTTGGDDLYLQTNELLGVGYDPDTIVGGVAVFNGNVGIGITAPGEVLEVVGNIAVSGNVDGRDVSTDGGVLDTLNTNVGQITAAEADQIENIGTETISNTQWGYLGVLDQNLRTSDTVQFGGLSIGSTAPVMTSILDEDAFTSDSATALATQQSIKAYVDTQVGTTDNYGSWVLAGDSGTPQTIGSGNTASVLGGVGITTSAGATDDVTVTFDSTELTNLIWGAGSTYDWTFNTGTTDPVLGFGDGFINLSTGNLGIGVTNPTEKLEVLGNVDITGNIDTSGTIKAGLSNVAVTLATGYIDADAITLTSLGTGVTASTSGLEVQSNGLGLLQGCSNNQILKWSEGTGTWVCQADDTGGAGVWTQTGTNLSPTTGGDDVYLQTNELLGVGYDPDTIVGGVAVFNGNVGIGITAPGEALEVVGNISVSGNVDGRDVSTDGGVLDTLNTNVGQITAAEADQIENIGTETISNTQWGYLGVLDQNLRTSDTVQFGGLSIGATAPVMTSILDEDDLTSDSAVALATQQSIKAYVDTQVGTTDNYGSWVLAGDSGTPQTIGSGNTASVLGGVGITTSAGATDDVTVTFDSTELTNLTWGSGSTYDWTFNTGATDPVLGFGDGYINLSTGNLGIGVTNPTEKLEIVGNIDLSGNLIVGGTVDGKDIATNAAMLNEAESITGVWEVQDDTNFVFGDDANWLIQYDETTNDRLDFVSSGTLSGDNDVYWDLVDTGSDSTYTITNSNGTYEVNLSVEGDITGGGAVSGNTLVSTTSTGTAPITVSSTTVVTNLNADTVDGYSEGALLKSNTSDNYTSGTLTFDSGTTLNMASGSTLDLDNITASRIISVGAGGVVASADLNSWIAGTTNEITVTDDADGSVTLSLPDEVYLGTSGKLGRDADNLIDFSADNQLTWRVGAADELRLTASALYPATDKGLDIGTTAAYWNDLYLDGGTIYFDDTTDAQFGYDSTADYFTFNPDGTGNSEMILTDAGLLGLGTTSPSAQFHIGIGSTASIGQIIELASGATADAFQINTNGGLAGDIFVVKSNGNVGIGTTNPDTMFTVGGTANVGPSGTVYMSNDHLLTSAASIETAGRSGFEVNIAAGSGSDFYGSRGDVALNGSANYTGSSIGAYGSSQQGSTGTAEDAFGVYGSVNAAVGAGNLNNAVGVHGSVVSATTNGTTNAMGLRSEVLTFLSGEITNGYGLYINDIVATNDFGVYQEGTDDTNYFAGNVGIGTTNPTEELEVKGDVLASGNIALNGAAINSNYLVNMGTAGNSSRGTNYTGTLTTDNASLYGAYNTLSTGTIAIAGVSEEQYVYGTYNDITVDSDYDVANSTYPFGMGVYNDFTLSGDNAYGYGVWNNATISDTAYFYGVLNGGDGFSNITSNQADSQLVGMLSALEATGNNSLVYGVYNNLVAEGASTQVYGAYTDAAVSGASAEGYGYYADVTSGNDAVR